MPDRYRVFGIKLPDAVVHAALDGTVVIDRDDQPVVRWRTEACKRVPVGGRSE